MAVEETDLRTFKSALDKEVMPDFTINIGEFSWKVHSRVISSSSNFFQKICNSEGQEATERTVTLHDDEPAIIAHLILWWYVGEYLQPQLPDENLDLDIHTIMKSGKTATSPDVFISDSDSNDWVLPEALHAKMYLVADKYGISDLGSLAIEEITTELGWDKAALLPCLTHLLAPAQTPGSNATATAKRIITDEQDPEIWDVLTTAASKDFFRYRREERFQQVMLENPAFQWRVMATLGTRLETAEAQLADVNASIPVPKMRKKRARKNPEG